jgi:hypothetical protein
MRIVQRSSEVCGSGALMQASYNVTADDRKINGHSNIVTALTVVRIVGFVIKFVK